MANGKLKTVLLLALPLVLCACGMPLKPYDPIAARSAYVDRILTSRASAHHLYTPDRQFVSMYDLRNTFVGINYVPEPEGQDNWQEPEVTWTTRSGDCEDSALLFIDLMYVTFGIKCDLVVTTASEEVADRMVADGGEIDHVIVRLADGTLYDPCACAYVTAPIQYVIPFDSIFNGK